MAVTQAFGLGSGGSRACGTSAKAIQAFGTAQAKNRAALGSADHCQEREDVLEVGGEGLLYELSCTTAFFDTITKVVDGTGHRAPAIKFGMMKQAMRLISFVGGPRNLKVIGGTVVVASIAAGVAFFRSKF